MKVALCVWAIAVAIAFWLSGSSVEQLLRGSEFALLGFGAGFIASKVHQMIVLWMRTRKSHAPRR